MFENPNLSRVLDPERRFLVCQRLPSAQPGEQQDCSRSPKAFPHRAEKGAGRRNGDPLLPRQNPNNRDEQ